MIRDLKTIARILREASRNSVRWSWQIGQFRFGQVLREAYRRAVRPPVLWEQKLVLTKPPERMLKEKLLAEARGILAWMIKGSLAWQERGLDPPASVLD